MIHIHKESWLKIEIENTLNDRIGMQKVLKVLKNGLFIIGQHSLGMDIILRIFLPPLMSMGCMRFEFSIINYLKILLLIRIVS